MNIRDWKEKANILVNTQGYFCIGFGKSIFKVGDIVEISLDPLIQPIIGKACIIGPSTYDEFLSQWKSVGFTCKLVDKNSNFYRCIVD